MTTFKIIPDTTQTINLKVLSTSNTAAIKIVGFGGPQGIQGVQGVKVFRCNRATGSQGIKVILRYWGSFWNISNSLYFFNKNSVI